MRTRVQCNCGWQRELSEFYAGKRIRCPECAAIVEVAGEDNRGAYIYPPMIDWPSGRHVKPQGKWVSLKGAPFTQRAVAAPAPKNGPARGRCCGGLIGLIVPLLIMLPVMISGHHRHDRDKPHHREPKVLRVEVELPAASPPAPGQPQPPAQALPPQEQSGTAPQAPADPDGEREDEF